ncbi:MAG: DegV family protein [Oscillospiraceae bacterium]|jgi:DegV family protein with EDD domain|nr:DegV family protein [Oscillospiraceae bacterium]
MKIKISADSTLDMPKALIEKYDIGIAAMPIVCGGKDYLDLVNIVPAQVFETVEAGGTVTTSTVPIGEYETLFSRWLEEYDAIIHIDISSELSACNQNAHAAIKLIDGAQGRVFPINSRNLSSSGAILAIEAYEMAQAGIPAAEIAETLSALSYKIDASFVIDTLKYLHRGGRCSSLAQFGANVLRLKPCIEVYPDTGKMDVGRKYRGSFENAILQYTEDRLKGRTDIDPSILFITYGEQTPPEIVDKVEARVRELASFDRIERSTAGTTIAVHSGPVVLGLLFKTTNTGKFK